MANVVKTTDERGFGEAILKVCEGISVKCSAELDTLKLSGSSDHQKYQISCAFFMIKSIRTLSAIRLLWRAGLDEDTIVLASPDHS
jgi:hypothetical protein